MFAQLKEFCSTNLPASNDAHNLRAISIDCSQNKSSHFDSDQHASSDQHTRDNAAVDQLLLNSSFSNSIVAGTFDRMHIGHKMLLSESVLLTRNRLLIGITDGAMLDKKKLSELIEDLDTRTANVIRFLNCVAPFLDTLPVPIYDPYGPSITEPDYECLIVSKETIAGGASVNKKRIESRLSEMAIHVVELMSETFFSQEDKALDDKVSSSNERFRLLGTLLKPPYVFILNYFFKIIFLNYFLN